MAEIIAANKSHQVAARLRRDIITGRYPAGVPLKSIRILAESFGVGRQVIYSALQTLESEKLIESRPRQGYLVRDRLTVSEHGILFLAYGVNEDNNYMHQLQKLTCPPHLPPGYNSWSRVVPRQSASPENWKMELRRVTEMSGIDFLLIHSNVLSREQVRDTLTLPLQVIFLADFAVGRFTDLPICQVVDDASAQVDLCFDYLVGEGCKKLVMITYPREEVYNREYIQVAESMAALRKINLKILSLSPSIYRNDHTYRLECLGQVLDLVGPEIDGIYLAGVDFDLVREARPDLVSRCRTIATNANSHKTAHLVTIFTNFYHTVYSLCDDQLAGRDITGRHVVHLEYRVVEP